MSAVRLFVLSALAEHGPMHGHQIRNQAQSDRAEVWTEVKVGALYGALKRLAGEGLIAEVRRCSSGTEIGDHGGVSPRGRTGSGARAPAL